VGADTPGECANEFAFFGDGRRFLSDYLVGAVSLDRREGGAKEMQVCVDFMAPGGEVEDAFNAELKHSLVD
jgi:hypothetical protein